MPRQPQEQGQAALPARRFGRRSRYLLRLLPAAAVLPTGLDWDGVRELGDVILGNTPGRTAPEEITLFKLQGLGIMDLAVGLRAYEALRDSTAVQRI